MSGDSTPVGLQPDGQIISRCGLICNTCTAFMTGACPGCHKLQAGECVIRDCADMLGTSCLDCRMDSCFHFEAYAIRRSLMNSKAKRYYRMLNPVGSGARKGGCGLGGGCGCRTGRGCGATAEAKTGCNGCPAARMAETLAALAR